MRAATTRVSLKTSRSPDRRNSGKAVMVRSETVPVAPSSTSSRLAETLGQGTLGDQLFGKVN